MSDRVTTPFGFDSTAADVIAGVDLTGKTAIVTGASSGIGVETARALAAAGASVTLAVRNTSFGDRVAAEIRESTGNQEVDVGAIDLSDLSSVAAFVRAWTGPLDILVNNAGVMAVPELTMSPSGHELQFASNHLGHFALAVGLHDALAAARQGPRGVGEFGGPSALTGRVRRHRLRVPRLRPVQRLRTVQDRQCAVRRRGHSTMGRRRHHVERADARRDLRHPAGTPRRREACGCGDEGNWRSRPSSRVRRRRCCWRRHRRSTASAAATSRTATRPRSSNDAGAPGSGGVAAYALDPANAERLWEVSLEDGRVRARR